MFSKFTKKIFRCPQCSQQLRVPVRPGKTLRVTCRRCGAMFDVGFKSPLLELFQWEKGRTLKYNWEGFRLRYRAMPFKAKISVWLNLFILFVILNLVATGVSALMNKDEQGQQPPKIPVEELPYEVI